MFLFKYFPQEGSEYHLEGLAPGTWEVIFIFPAYFTHSASKRTLWESESSYIHIIAYIEYDLFYKLRIVHPCFRKNSYFPSC